MLGQLVPHPLGIVESFVALADDFNPLFAAQLIVLGADVVWFLRVQWPGLVPPEKEPLSVAHPVLLGVHAAHGHDATILARRGLVCIDARRRVQIKTKEIPSARIVVVAEPRGWVLSARWRC